MSDTFNVLADIISSVCNIERSAITPESNTVEDLGIDSVDFLDVVYEIDQRLKVKVPAVSWVEKVNSGKATTEDYFVMSKLVEHIDALIASKPSA